MTYLIGVILILLIIALVLVFRPPRPKPHQEASPQETVEDGSKVVDEQLDLDIEYGGKKTVAVEEELDLIFDEPDIASSEGVADLEELDLVLEDEGVDERTEEKGRDEYDEDIPFIDEGEGAFVRKGEMEFAPALADIPDGYAQIEEDETPEDSGQWVIRQWQSGVYHKDIQIFVPHL